MTNRRKALIAGAAMLGLLLAILLAVVQLLPAERIGRMAVLHAEAALDREVRMETFGVRILPRPAVTIEGVAVSRDARPDARSGLEEGGFEPLLASIERIELRPRLPPLLRGRVVIHELVLDGPGLFLHVPEGGTLELPSVADADPEADEAEVRIRTVRIRHGRLEYRDDNTGNSLTLAGIEHRIGLDGPLTGGATDPLALGGALSIGEMVMHFPGVVEGPLTAPPVRVEHEMQLVRADDRMDIERLDVRVGEVPVTFTGSVDALSDAVERRASLSGRTEGVEIAGLFHSLPPELLDRFRSPGGDRLTGTAGTLDLDVAVVGRVVEGETPEVSGRLRFEGVELAFDRRSPGTAALVDGLEGEVRFGLESASTDGLSGRFLGEPFHVAFEVYEPTEPRGSVAIRGALDLEEAGRAGLLPDGTGGRGRIVADFVAGGHATDPGSVRADGSVDFVGLELVTEALARPVAVDDGRLTLAGRSVVARGLRATVGASDATLDLEASNWPEYVLGEGGNDLQVTFDLRSRVLDADDLFGADLDRTPYGQLLFAHLADRPVDGRSAAAAAEDMGLELPHVPPGLRLDGRVRAATVVSAGIEHRNLEATVTARRGDLEMPSAILETMGGRAELWAWLGAGDGSGFRPLALRYGVTGVTADPFLQHHTLFRGRVGGTLSLAGSAEMRLRPDALPDAESVTGEGVVGIQDGELRNWPPVRELGRTLGLQDVESLEFRDWTGRYAIAGSRILIQETRLEGREAGIRASGSFDVAGNLDVAATLHLPASWVEEIPGAAPALLASLLADAEGRIPIGAVITGTTSSPEIALDLAELGAVAAERAREEAERRIREEAGRLSEELGVERPSPPSREAVADSLRNRLEEEIRNRLRTRIPRGGGGLPGP